MNEEQLAKLLKDIQDSINKAHNQGYAHTFKSQPAFGPSRLERIAQLWYRSEYLSPGLLPGSAYPVSGAAYDFTLVRDMQKVLEDPDVPSSC